MKRYDAPILMLHAQVSLPQHNFSLPPTEHLRRGPPELLKSAAKDNTRF